MLRRSLGVIEGAKSHVSQNSVCRLHDTAALKRAVFFSLFAGVAVSATHASAYIGPGAGFALVSSFLTLLIAFGTAFLALFTLPIRLLIRRFRNKKAPRKAQVKKVVMLGLDGLDPDITDELLAKGELPNFAKLRESGTYARLGTSNPAMSPVAWSSFSTGSDASYHGIYDFLARDKRTYLPKTSSSAVYGEAKFLKIGPWYIPRGKGGVRFLRKGKSFWKTLSDYGIFSTILRVPITFPPEEFNGLMIAGMDVPDLRGTMGTFTFYTQSEQADKIGGMVIKLDRSDGPLTSKLPGPVNPLTGDPVELDVKIVRSGSTATITVGDETFELKEREYSPWIRLTFKAAMNIKMTGIARFYVTSMNGDFGLYVTPIHIDPESPVMPVASPSVYSTYLAKLHGPYATLGLAEDTWAINERVLDEDGWIDQAYLFYKERKEMWFHALDRLSKGVVCCVFDISDRLQHICFRYLDDDHPANEGKDMVKHKDALYDMYREMDKLVGETMKYIDKDTAFFVMSDHGFKTFKRGVNLNSWLREEGYLVMKPGEEDSEYLAGVDWSKTKAYALGLGGMYVNVKGRESQGIVEPGDRQQIIDDITAKITQLVDPKSGGKAVNAVTDVQKEFTGPYRKEGPDMLTGFAVGWRVSWECAQGKVTPEIFDDNVKSWSGDHCIDPTVVPGILFTNQKINTDAPRLMDLGPTVLDLYGIDAPGHMVGKSIIGANGSQQAKETPVAASNS